MVAALHHGSDEGPKTGALVGLTSGAAGWVAKVALIIATLSYSEADEGLDYIVAQKVLMALLFCFLTAIVAVSTGLFAGFFGGVLGQAINDKMYERRMNRKAFSESHRLHR